MTDRERAIEREKKRSGGRGREERTRERKKGRVEQLTRDGKFPLREKEEEARKEGERERGEEEMKTFLLPPLLATKAISVARRHEERGEGRTWEGWGKRERERTWERGRVGFNCSDTAIEDRYLLR